MSTLSEVGRILWGGRFWGGRRGGLSTPFGVGWVSGITWGGRSRGIVRLKFLAVVGFVWTRLVLGWWGSWGS